ncbi:hypothetical protein ACTXT7_001262 [Hymenolepis weldensis]
MSLYAFPKLLFTLILTHEAALSAASSKTQDWMAENFHNHGTPNLKWPSNSSDPNPFDYYVWGKNASFVVKRQLSKENC